MKELHFLFAVLLLLANSTNAQNWNEIIKATAYDRGQSRVSDRAANDNFGYSVSISGDYAIVGARNEDENAIGGATASNAGSAYMFVRTGGVWELQQKIVAADRAANDQFGTSVSISGDYAIVGAPFTSGGGSAYIFNRTGRIWVQQQKIVAADRAADDRFGHSVAISDNYAIVGANWDDEDASGGASASFAGSAYIFNRTGSIWAQQQKIVAADRGGGDQFGHNVSISGDYTIVGAYHEDEDASGGATLSGAGSAYIFYRTGNSWVQQQKIVAVDRADGDSFGYSVSISGDYAIVGARQEDHNASGGAYVDRAGSAYIFSRSGSTWTQQQKIVAADRAAFDYFGHSVSISGDYAIVGAYLEDHNAIGMDSASDAGSAYIFYRTGSTWTQQQKIVAADRAGGDNFGNSVSISGDYAIAGADEVDNDANGGAYENDAGSTYIFNRSDSTWSQKQKIVAERVDSVTTNDRFGTSVSISGDYAIVGAYQEDEDTSGWATASDAGSAYIFVRSTSGWVLQQKIVAADRAAFDQFGWSVSISGDYAIVGAYPQDQNTSGMDGGSAYIFYRTGSTWTQQQKIVAADRAAFDRFGYSVAISGDYAIVGAYEEDEDASGGATANAAGSAYIFHRTGSTWTQQQKIVAADREQDDYFGYSVAINGDYIIVGAYQEDHNASGGVLLDRAGSAYIFSLSGNIWTQQQKIVAADRAVVDYFGYSVAISGDYAIVGAYSENEDASGGAFANSAGSAYIFNRSGSTWTQQQKIVASDRAQSDWFGYSVSISGDYAIVGASFEDQDATGGAFASNAGSAYIFNRSGSTWTQQQKIVAADRATVDYFGHSVSISGEYAIVGSYLEDEDANGGNTISGSGSAYIFNNNSTPVTWYLDDDNDGYYTNTQVSINSPGAGWTSTLPNGGSGDCAPGDNTKWQTLSGYADSDGDGYTVGSLLNNVCSGTSLPAGYATTSAGTDCDDNDNTKWQTLSGYADSDGDGYTVGSLLNNVCSGASLPSGYSPTSLGTDCNDNAAAFFTTYPFYADTDGDGFGAGASSNQCALNAATAPSGYSVNNTDCAAGDNTKWQNLNGYTDVDGDSYTVGSIQSICSGASLPAGYAAATLGTDCNDNDGTLQEVCNPNAIGQFIQDGNIFIYPNPSTGIINIEFETNESFDIAIYDVMGRRVEADIQQKQINASPVKIDIAALPKAVYQLKLTGKKGSLVRRIVKE